MNHFTPLQDPISTEEATPYLGPAQIDEVLDGGERVLVTLPEGAGGTPYAQPGQPAEIAMEARRPFQVGERVLVTLGSGSEGTAYLIGRLGGVATAKPDTPSGPLTTESGASAHVTRDERGERIQVRNDADELLFEYDPEGGSARLVLPEGSLDLVTPGGDLNLAAGGAVRIRGETVDLAARSAVRLRVLDVATKVLGALTLGTKGTRLRTNRVSVEAEHSDTRVRTQRIRAERIDTEAEKVTERFGTLLQTVKGVIQTRAGRLRTLVSGSWHSRAQRADLRSRETFKVDGERIHLG